MPTYLLRNYEENKEKKKHPTTTSSKVSHYLLYLILVWLCHLYFLLENRLYFEIPYTIYFDFAFLTIEVFPLKFICIFSEKATKIWKKSYFSGLLRIYEHWTLSITQLISFVSYSQVPNKRVGPNKQVGWLCWANFINE